MSVVNKKAIFYVPTHTIPRIGKVFWYCKVSITSRNVPAIVATLFVLDACTNHAWRTARYDTIRKVCSKYNNIAQKHISHDRMGISVNRMAKPSGDGEESLFPMLF